MNRWRRLVVPVVLCVLSAAHNVGAEMAFLVWQPPGTRLDVETYRAWVLAQELGARAILFPQGRGDFVDEDGRAVSLGQFRLVWHYGARPARSPGGAESLASLRPFVVGGGRLLVSGAGTGLITSLGIEGVRTEPVTFGHDRAQVGLVPLSIRHPVFSGLDLEGGVLWLSNAAFPAFARFDSSTGQVLARAPGDAQCTLVEYVLGEGRVIALPWRLSAPHRNAPARYRERFRGLLKNLIGYLREDGPPQRPHADSPVPPDWEALELAISDLIATFGDRYPGGPQYLGRLKALESRDAELRADQGAVAADEQPEPRELLRQFEALLREALLANPLLDFKQLLVVKRGVAKLGLPLNFHGNSSLEPNGYDNEIAMLAPARPAGELVRVYEPEGGRFVGDVDLHFDGSRLLFSMPDAQGRWRVWEIRVDGSGLEAIAQIDEPDVDNYDACYVPDDRIIFSSTACFTGVPCVGGRSHVANLYLSGPEGHIRQLTVEQDHDWCPTVLPNGRILYLRWEYTDTPHAFSRILFHMNPDGTQQAEFYGSGSYWPNSMFYARPLPGHAAKVVAVVGGHHDVPRMGELVIFDPARGRLEAEGAIQRIPGRARRVEPAVLDLVTARSWPKFLHPFPLSEKYFLVSCKPTEGSLWGIYLVDVFDNLVLLREEPGYALLEPLPSRKVPRPPVLPDRVDLTQREAEVLMVDVYQGPGLTGVPRGTVKALRVISYHFAYQGMGAEPDSVGLDGPWDPKRILGTVPVYEDGSARFRVPAYTPLAVQPLDAKGRAVQLMRSWFTAMPGEVLSCVGCHEKQNTAPPVQDTIAARRPSVEIAPWYGPPRGFSFRREVQPVLDKFCVGCHGGKTQSDGRALPDLRDSEPKALQENSSPHNLNARFTRSYYHLRRFVRTPTKESDMHLLPPWEFHADTTRLVQMLDKGHHNVELDDEAWDRLITWIDLNAPAHGNWTEICGRERVDHQRERRRLLRVVYTGRDEDPEADLAELRATPPAPLPPERQSTSPTRAVESHRRRRGSEPPTKCVDLGAGVTMELIQIPPGEFILGDPGGCADERPACSVTIERPFWIGRYEVTNAQFARFDPRHDSRLENGDFIQFSQGERGWPMNEPWQPVVRVSWWRAVEFCRWLSTRTNHDFALPSEAEWEYACRAGMRTAFWYGERDADFSAFANLSDVTNQAIDPFGWSGRVAALPGWRPADLRFNDDYRVTAPAGLYRPNPWGLFDMHGNAAEWTRSAYQPYPYNARDGREDPVSTKRRVVRGGSWYDTPERCRSAFRQPYAPDQGVFDVGFRVICAQP